MKRNTTKSRAACAALGALLVAIPINSLAHAAGLDHAHQIGQQYSVTLSGMGQTVELTRTEAGYDYAVVGDPSSTGHLSDSSLARLETSIVSAEADHLLGTIGIPDGLGAVQHYTLDGKFDALDGNFRGSMLAANGSSIEPIEIRAPGSGELQTDAVIIITAGAILVLLCFILELESDCSGDCTNTCRENGGVKKFTDGWCGSCSCTCEGTN